MTRLGERHRELRRQEEDARRRAAYENAKAERDRLAAELAQVYPSMVAQLTELLVRIEASDWEIEYINERALPAHGHESCLLGSS